MDTNEKESDTASKVRDVAEKAVEQARNAIGTALDAARSAADSIQGSTKTAETQAGLAVTRGFGFAKENISAIFDFAQQLVRAPDLNTAVKMQSDFVTKQSAEMQKQVAELREMNPPKKD